MHQTIKRRSLRASTTTKISRPPPIKKLRGRVYLGTSGGIIHTQPSTALNLDKLMACARNSKNEWGIIDQGTLEQMNGSRSSRRAWKACGASQKLIINGRRDPIVNGASTCNRILCLLHSVRIALYTTEATTRRSPSSGSGRATVSEAQEEGLVRLANGLKITYSTVTAGQLMTTVLRFVLISMLLKAMKLY